MQQQHRSNSQLQGALEEGLEQTIPEPNLRVKR